MKTGFAALVGTLILAGSLSAKQADSYYIQFNIIEGDTFQYLEPNTRGGCVVQPGEECRAVVYRSFDGSSGIFVGSGMIRKSNSVFECLITLSVVVVANQPILTGTAYTLHMASSGEIVGGSKTEIQRDVQFGKQNLFPVGASEMDEPVTLQVTVMSRPEYAGADRPDQPISMSSTQFLEGGLWSHANFTKSQLNEITRFNGGFSTKPKAGLYEFCKYQVTVTLEPSTTISGVTHMLTYDRSYRIDTLHHKADSFTNDVAYTSKFTKMVDLTPGNLLRLIFPADTPSVRGFDIEDTLVLRP